jgi:hypothetical protein
VPKKEKPLSLRDRIALKFMLAIARKAPYQKGTDPNFDPLREECVARGAYSYAEAFLRERESHNV